MQIRPRKRRQQRSIDTIGTVWKWVSGSPDADDLRIINKTMNELIDGNNRQYKVNEQLGKRIQLLTKAINEVIESKNNNQIILDEIETLSTIIKIDTINKLLEAIQEAIILSKISIVSNKILSLSEVITIKSLLEEQGIIVDIPDKALSLIKPKIAISDNTLLYITRVPQLKKEEATIIRIVPLNQEGKIIKNHPDFVIKAGTNFYITTKPDEYIQQSSFLRELSDGCIKSLLSGKQSKCSQREQTKTEVLAISNNLILINNARRGLFSSNCGPDNRTLIGNFLISFFNCTIHYENKSFAAGERTIQTSILQGAMHDLIIDQQPEENDLHQLNNMTLTNRRKIDHVYLKQFSHDIWNWSLLGGIFVSMTITITVSIFALLYYRKLFYVVLSKIARKRKPKISSSPTIPNQDA